LAYIAEEITHPVQLAQINALLQPLHALLIPGKAALDVCEPQIDDVPHFDVSTMVQAGKVLTPAEDNLSRFEHLVHPQEVFLLQRNDNEEESTPRLETRRRLWAQSATRQPHVSPRSRPAESKASVAESWSTASAALTLAWVLHSVCSDGCFFRAVAAGVEYYLAIAAPIISIFGYEGKGERYL
ncbi:hypothetical protein H0H81_004100, partial [Sphagnurus paluster]